MQKQIQNFLNYLIDDEGNVFNIEANKMLQGSIGEHGYKYYRLSKDGQKKMFYAHRLVAEYFIPNPNNLPIVNHKDGNKLNNNVKNLEWTTKSENTRQWHELSGNKANRVFEYYVEDLPTEIWKEYGNYMVSSCGRVRHKIKNNLLKPVVTCGYYKVTLSENGVTTDYMLHKLIWNLFVPIEENSIEEGMVIDHIDANKLNNNINNLRKITLSENVNAGLYEQKTNKTVKRVGQYDLNNNFIAEFVSVAEAGRQLNLDKSTISKVCRGQNKTHGGYIFKYLNN